MPEPRRSSGVGARSEVLTSRDNRWLKEFRVALRGGLPTASGAVGVEGARLVEEALSSGCRVEAVLFSENGERFRERLAPLIGRPDTGFAVLRTTDRLFEGLADTEHPQGVAALVIPRKWTLEELLTAQQSTVPPLVMVLAGVQDPGNVGTVLRTAAAFGATGVVTTGTGQSGTASPYAPKALRASAGAALHLPVVSGMGIGILLTQLKMNGVRTLASSVHAENDSALAPWEVDWKQSIALLVGNEGAGLPADVLDAADGRIRIPMAAQVESLNAGAAAAVVLYEAYKQRLEVGR